MGYISLDLNQPLKSEGIITINGSQSGFGSFTTTSEVYRKLMGDTWYVDAENGNNFNSGKTRDDPFKTITYALIQANGIEVFL